MQVVDFIHQCNRARSLKQRVKAVKHKWCDKELAEYQQEIKQLDYILDKYHDDFTNPMYYSQREIELYLEAIANQYIMLTRFNDG